MEVDNTEGGGEVGSQTCATDEFLEKCKVLVQELSDCNSLGPERKDNAAPTQDKKDQVNETKVKRLIELWGQFKDEHGTSFRDSIDRCFESLLVSTSRLILNVQYTKCVPVPTKEALKLGICQCGESFVEGSVQHRLCRGLSSVVVNPWKATKFNLAMGCEKKSDNATAEELWTTEGRVMIETRLHYLAMIGATNHVCSVLHILVIKINDEVKSGVDTTKALSNKRFQPYGYPTEKYYDYLGAYGMLCFLNYINKEVLEKLDEWVLLQAVSSLKDKASEDCWKNSRVILWSHVKKGAVFVARRATWKALKSKSSTHLEKLFKAWIDLSSATDESSPVDEILKDTEEVYSSEYLYRLAQLLKPLESQQTPINQNFIELFLCAMQKDMSTIETLKNSVKDESEHIASLERKLSRRFLDLAKCFKEFPRIAGDCVLTAFSLNPCNKIYQFLFPDDSENVNTTVEENGQELWDQFNELGEISLESDESSSKDTGLPPALVNDLINIIKNPQYKGFVGRNSRTTVRDLCRKLLESKSIAVIENRALDHLDVDYDKYKHLKSQYDPDDDGIEKGYRFGERFSGTRRVQAQSKYMKRTMELSKKALKRGRKVQARMKPRQKEVIRLSKRKVSHGSTRRKPCGRSHPEPYLELASSLPNIWLGCGPWTQPFGPEIGGYFAEIFQICRPPGAVLNVEGLYGRQPGRENALLDSVKCKLKLPAEENTRFLAQEPTQYNSIQNSAAPEAAPRMRQENLERERLCVNSNSPAEPLLIQVTRNTQDTFVPSYPELPAYVTDPCDGLMHTYMYNLQMRRTRLAQPQPQQQPTFSQHVPVSPQRHLEKIRKPKKPVDCTLKQQENANKKHHRPYPRKVNRNEVPSMEPDRDFGDAKVKTDQENIESLDEAVAASETEKEDRCLDARVEARASMMPGTGETSFSGAVPLSPVAVQPPPPPPPKPVPVFAGPFEIMSLSSYSAGEKQDNTRLNLNDLDQADKPIAKSTPEPVQHVGQPSEITPFVIREPSHAAMKKESVNETKQISPENSRQGQIHRNPAARATKTYSGVKRKKLVIKGIMNWGDFVGSCSVQDPPENATTPSGGDSVVGSTTYDGAAGSISYVNPNPCSSAEAPPVVEAMQHMGEPIQKATRPNNDCCENTLPPVPSPNKDCCENTLPPVPSPNNNCCENTLSPVPIPNTDCCENTLPPVPSPNTDYCENTLPPVPSPNNDCWENTLPPVPIPNTDCCENTLPPVPIPNTDCSENTLPPVPSPNNDCCENTLPAVPRNICSTTESIATTSASEKVSQEPVTKKLTMENEVNTEGSSREGGSTVEIVSCNAKEIQVERHSVPDKPQPSKTNDAGSAKTQVVRPEEKSKGKVNLHLLSNLLRIGPKLGANKNLVNRAPSPLELKSSATKKSAIDKLQPTVSFGEKIQNPDNSEARELGKETESELSSAETNVETKVTSSASVTGALCADESAPETRNKNADTIDGYDLPPKDSSKSGLHVVNDRQETIHTVENLVHSEQASDPSKSPPENAENGECSSNKATEEPPVIKVEQIPKATLPVGDNSLDDPNNTPVADQPNDKSVKCEPEATDIRVEEELQADIIKGSFVPCVSGDQTEELEEDKNPGSDGAEQPCEHIPPSDEAESQQAYSSPQSCSEDQVNETTSCGFQDFGNVNDIESKVVKTILGDHELQEMMNGLPGFATSKSIDLETPTNELEEEGDKVRRDKKNEVLEDVLDASPTANEYESEEQAGLEPCQIAEEISDRLQGGACELILFENDPAEKVCEETQHSTLPATSEKFLPVDMAQSCMHSNDCVICIEDESSDCPEISALQSTPHLVSSIPPRPLTPLDEVADFWYKTQRETKRKRLYEDDDDLQRIKIAPSVREHFARSEKKLRMRSLFATWVAVDRITLPEKYRDSLTPVKRSRRLERKKTRHVQVAKEYLSSAGVKDNQASSNEDSDSDIEIVEEVPNSSRNSSPLRFSPVARKHTHSRNGIASCQHAQKKRRKLIEEKTSSTLPPTSDPLYLEGSSSQASHAPVGVQYEGPTVDPLASTEEDVLNSSSFTKGDSEENSSYGTQYTFADCDISGKYCRNSDRGECFLVPDGNSVYEGPQLGLDVTVSEANHSNGTINDDEDDDDDIKIIDDEAFQGITNGVSTKKYGNNVFRTETSNGVNRDYRASGGGQRPRRLTTDLCDQKNTPTEETAQVQGDNLPNFNDFPLRNASQVSDEETPDKSVKVQIEDDYVVEIDSPQVFTPLDSLRVAIINEDKAIQPETRFDEESPVSGYSDESEPVPECFYEICFDPGEEEASERGHLEIVSKPLPETEVKGSESEEDKEELEEVEGRPWDITGRNEVVVTGYLVAKHQDFSRDHNYASPENFGVLQEQPDKKTESVLKPATAELDETSNTVDEEAAIILEKTISLLLQLQEVDTHSQFEEEPEKSQSQDDQENIVADALSQESGEHVDSGSVDFSDDGKEYNESMPDLSPEPDEYCFRLYASDDEPPVLEREEACQILV